MASSSPGIIADEWNNDPRISVLLLKVIGVNWIWERIKTSRVFIFRLEKNDWATVCDLILRNRLADRGDVIICSSKIIWCPRAQSSLYALQPSRKATAACFSIDVLDVVLDEA